MIFAEIKGDLAPSTNNTVFSSVSISISKLRNSIQGGVHQDPGWAGAGGRGGPAADPAADQVLLRERHRGRILRRGRGAGGAVPRAEGRGPRRAGGARDGERRLTVGGLELDTKVIRMFLKISQSRRRPQHSV